MRSQSALVFALLAAVGVAGCRSGSPTPGSPSTMDPAYRAPQYPSYDGPSQPTFSPTPVPPVPGIEATPDLSVPPAPPAANAPRRLPLGSASWKQPMGKMKASLTAVAAKFKPGFWRSVADSKAAGQAELAGSIDDLQPQLTGDESEPLPEMIAPPTRRSRAYETVSGSESTEKSASSPAFNRRPVPLPTGPIIQPAPTFPAVPEATPVLQPVPSLPSFSIPPVEQTTHRSEVDATPAALPVIAPGRTGFSRPRLTPPLDLSAQ